MPRFLLEPSRIAGRDYEVKLSGEMRTAGAKPELAIDVEAAGLDKVIARLQAAAAAGDPNLYQVVGMLSFGKGFAEPLPGDRYHWLVETGGNGSVSVNGHQVKGPDVPAVPAPQGYGVPQRL